MFELSSRFSRGISEITELVPGVNKIFRSAFRVVPLETKTDPKGMVEFVDKHISLKFTHLTRGTPPTKLSFYALWYVFKPGTEVVEHSGQEAYLVFQVCGSFNSGE
jgi:hypothetical protein